MRVRKRALCTHRHVHIRKRVLRCEPTQTRTGRECPFVNGHSAQTGHNMSKALPLVNDQIRPSTTPRASNQVPSSRNYSKETARVRPCAPPSGDVQASPNAAAFRDVSTSFCVAKRKKRDEEEAKKKRAEKKKLTHVGERAARKHGVDDCVSRTGGRCRRGRARSKILTCRGTTSGLSNILNSVDRC